MKLVNFKGAYFSKPISLTFLTSISNLRCFSSLETSSLILLAGVPILGEWRRYTSTSYKELVDNLRKTIPGVSLSTDIIVGFPNETEEEFMDTLKMVEYVRYDSAFTFICISSPHSS